MFVRIIPLVHETGNSMFVDGEETIEFTAARLNLPLYKDQILQQFEGL